MISYFSGHLWQFWTLIGFICLILELTSGDFFIMCFSIGAFVTAIVSAIFPGPSNFIMQIIVFAVVSLLCLLFVRPLALKYFHRKGGDRLSNVDAMIGRKGVVTDSIPAEGYGRVKIDGDSWKACSEDGIAIDKDSHVEVVSMESTIITVRPY